ncbi:MAG: hypothetical protein NT067_06315 [Candidatus Diapherotrites archaeon]|nr:hypothetical protein [Candidatus Diapherotrites archaeon]
MKLWIFLLVLFSVLFLLCGCSELQHTGTASSPSNPSRPYVAKMLIIGKPSPETLEALGNSKDLAEFVVKDEAFLSQNALEKLADYNIVMLDQSGQESKMLSSAAAEALSAFAEKGGKLIVVKNSGIYSPDAPEIIGWTANFGSEIVPVDCVFTRENKPSCTLPVNVTAVLERVDYDHPIMLAIDRVPETKDMPYLSLETFPVSATGNEIAIIKDANSTKYYPGIAEKTGILGKSIYFNYNPGLTPAILRNTLRYLQ